MLKKFLVGLSVLTIQVSWALDTYNPLNNQLSIPQVVLGQTVYTNVVITVGQVLAVSGGAPAQGFDVYDPATNQLKISDVTVDESQYTNVLVTVGQVISLGGSGDLATVTQLSIPTDVLALTYPTSYQQSASSNGSLVTDPCRLDMVNVTYPKSWIGQYELPKIVGAPLKSTYQRGMYLKDIMLTDNPTFNPGCKGSLKAEFDRTIDRLKKLNVDIVYIPQWHWIGTRSDGSWYIMRVEDSFGPLSDDNLSYFVQAAHKAGLKVLMNNQIQGMMQSNGMATTPLPTPENFARWFAAYSAFIQERAPFFQGLGIDAWELGCNACIFQDWGRNTNEDNKYFADEYEKILPIMKTIYKGQVVMFANGWLLDKPAMLDSIDIIVTGIWDGGFLPSAQKPFNVQNYKAALLNNGLSQGVFNTWDRPGKSLLISPGIQSRSNWFSAPGYLEETGCVSSMGSFNTSTSGCLERETAPDFSLQAIYYEALFEALAGINFKGNIIVAPGDMWETNSMVSESVFPNIGASIRNKPAEGVIKTWFAR